MVLGSSPNGALDRVAIGGNADRILHSAGVPVPVAPRQGFRPGRHLSRITVAFGRGDGDSDLLARAADRAASVGARLRVVCFAVEPIQSLVTLGGTPGEGETLVAERWVDQLRPSIVATLETTAASPSADRIDITVGRSAPIGRLFLGSHAAKIVRNSPVPVVLVPRSVLARSG